VQRGPILQQQKGAVRGKCATSSVSAQGTGSKPTSAHGQSR
jgi:hypothetical protein